MDQIPSYIQFLRKYPTLKHNNDFINFLKQKYNLTFINDDENYIRKLISKYYPNVSERFFNSLEFLYKERYIDPYEDDEEYDIYLFKTYIKYKDEIVPLVFKIIYDPDYKKFKLSIIILSQNNNKDYFEKYFKELGLKNFKITRIEGTLNSFFSPDLLDENFDYDTLFNLIDFASKQDYKNKGLLINSLEDYFDLPRENDKDTSVKNYLKHKYHVKNKLLENISFIMKYNYNGNEGFLFRIDFRFRLSNYIALMDIPDFKRNECDIIVCLFDDAGETLKKNTQEFAILRFKLHKFFYNNGLPVEENCISECDRSLILSIRMYQGDDSNNNQINEVYER